MRKRLLETKFIDQTLALVSDVVKLQASLFLVGDEEAEVHYFALLATCMQDNDIKCTYSIQHSSAVCRPRTVGPLAGQKWEGTDDHAAASRLAGQ